MKQYVYRAATALWLLMLGSVCAEPLFNLIDSGPGSKEFQRRFMASYGVNSAIEPPLDPADRPLYRRIEPLLEKDPREAIKQVERERAGKGSPAFSYLLGNLYYQLDELDSAERNLKAAIEAFPPFRRAHRTLGLVYIRTGRYAEAADSWRTVVALGGGDAQSYGLLGYALINREHAASALSAYRMARMFDPERADFRRGEAHSLWLMGHHREAIALLDELLADHPETLDYWLAQANAYLRDEQYDQALVNLEMVRALGGAETASLLLLGDLYLQRGLIDQALDVFRETFRSAPPPAPARVIRPVDALLAAGRPAAAEAYLNQLEAAYPEFDHPERDIARAAIRLEQGDVEDAMVYLQRVLDHDPLNGKALLMLGKCQRAAGETDLALLSLQRAAGISRYEAGALLETARIHVAGNDIASALPLLRRVHRLEPTPRLAAYIETLEDAHKHRGRTEE
jgi:tetratricopeptide (TPR) repeat protein